MALGAIRTLAAARLVRARRCLGRGIRRHRPRRLRLALADDRPPTALRGRSNRLPAPARADRGWHTPGRRARSNSKPSLVVRESTAAPRTDGSGPNRGARDDVCDPRRTARGLPLGLRPLVDECRRQQLQRPRSRADSVLLTPTGNAKRTRLRMSPDHLLHVRLDGTVLEGDGELSSSWPTHQGLYQAFPEIGAVIHAHPLYATIFAARSCDHSGGAGRNEEVRRRSRPSPVGTRSIVRLSSRKSLRFSRPTATRSRSRGFGVLYPGHGVLVAGPTLDDAYDLLERMEFNAAAFCSAACSTCLTPRAVPNECADRHDRQASVRRARRGAECRGRCLRQPRSVGRWRGQSARLFLPDRGRQRQQPGPRHASIGRTTGSHGIRGGSTWPLHSRAAWQ